MKKIVLKMVLMFCVTTSVFAQSDEIDHSYKPLTLKLDESGHKYVRFILWHQQWLVTNNLESDAKTQLTSFTRRSRFLAYAQISPRFLVLTHFGLNNLTPQGNLTSLGNNGDGPQLFLHDAWTEFKVSHNNALFIGSGIHYWKGLTRLSNQSTLNFMTLDNARPFVHWHSLGITDQFARHMGVYAKGQIGKFDYRVAMNNPLNPEFAIGGGNNFANSWAEEAGTTISELSYNGSNNEDINGDPVGNTVIEGYFRYNFFDTESTKLPYQVGTYFGKKKIFGIGAGFFSHTNAMFNETSGIHDHVFHIALDAFYDAPVGENGNAINAYASFISFDYGENYISRWAGTGSNLYAHLGYYIDGVQLMPYVAYQSGNYEAIEEPVSSLDIGVNYLLSGHNAKFTLEYHTIRNDFRDAPTTQGNVSQVRLQTVIFI